VPTTDDPGKAAAQAQRPYLLPPSEAARIAREELADLKRWLEDRWHATPRDTAILGFADAIEDRFVRQGRDENRSIEETLDIGWDLLRGVPESAITRIDQALIDEFLKGRAAE
jgi:vacuolar-type H+-ATPase subunit B/Vma2